jgi:hypothetical protein
MMRRGSLSPRRFCPEPMCLRMLVRPELTRRSSTAGVARRFPLARSRHFRKRLGARSGSRVSNRWRAPWWRSSSVISWRGRPVMLPLNTWRGFCGRLAWHDRIWCCGPRVLPADRLPQGSRLVAKILRQRSRCCVIKARTIFANCVAALKLEVLNGLQSSDRMFSSGVDDRLPCPGLPIRPRCLRRMIEPNMSTSIDME